jgi:hypothetical protein
MIPHPTYHDRVHQAIDELGRSGLRATVFLRTLDRCNERARSGSQSFAISHRR